MERRGLLCLVLALTGCLTTPLPQTPVRQDLNQLDPRDPDHEAIVEITKFVRDVLAFDVQANRKFAERSNNQTEAIANAIVQHVKDLNRTTTTKFEEILRKLEKLENEKDEMRKVVEEMHDSFHALKGLVVPHHTVDLDSLDVLMPVPESELLFPRSNFFNKRMADPIPLNPLFSDPNDMLK